MSAPKPHDPRTTAVRPEDLTRTFDEILAQPADTLAEEVDLLARAHSVLHDALQDN
ncbi:hypothetical protein [Corynebacterium sp.]|uniref:hypothetical protein n=1 Tax=Corynebacterium sp. TaxID=1720 RepID=UPI003734C116